MPDCNTSSRHQHSHALMGKLSKLIMNQLSMCTMPAASRASINEQVDDAFDVQVDDVAVDPPVFGTQKPRSYHSDVHCDKPPLVSGLVHAHHINKFDKKYDLTDSKMLGQGTCGYVCSVRARATGDLFALKEREGAHALPESGWGGVGVGVAVGARDRGRCHLMCLVCS